MTTLPNTTQHHTLTLEHARYPLGGAEVTAAFCDCGETFEIEAKTASAQIGSVAMLFALHVQVLSVAIKKGK